MFVAAAVAALLGLCVGLVEKRRSPRTGFFWLFMVFLAVTWAGGVWLQPFGPAWWGVRWVPFLAVGGIFGLVVLLLQRGRPPHGRRETIEKLEEIAREKQLQEATFFTLGLVFWLLLFFLALAVAFRYLLR
jgi:hypothetical protein